MHQMGQHFTYVEKTQSKVTSSSGHQSSMASPSPLMPDAGQFAYMPPPVPRWKDPIRSPRRTGVTVALAKCHEMHALQTKTKEQSLKLKQGKILPHKVISPA